MKYLVILLVVQFVVVYSKPTSKLPAACHRSDPEVGKCFLKAFEEMLVLLRQGVSEYKIPSFEPLLIPRFDFDRKLNDLIQANIVLTNVRVEGATSAKISDFKFDPDTVTSDFTLVHPQILANLDYQGAVKFSESDIHSQGHLTMTFDNIKSHIHISYKKVEKEDGEHFIVNSLKLKVKVQDAQLQIVSKTPDDQTFLGFVANTFNKNPRRYLDMLEPIYTEIMEERMVGEFNKLMIQIPASNILVD